MISWQPFPWVLMSPAYAFLLLIAFWIATIPMPVNEFARWMGGIGLFVMVLLWWTTSKHMIIVDDNGIEKRGGPFGAIQQFRLQFNDVRRMTLVTQAIERRGNKLRGWRLDLVDVDGRRYFVMLTEYEVAARLVKRKIREALPPDVRNRVDSLH